MRPEQPQFPQALLTRDQWVAATARPDPNRPGKSIKMLYNPRTGQPASPVDRSTWGSFEEASHRIAQIRKSAGKDVQVSAGFVFTADDPFTAIDFDHCFDEHDTLDAVTLRRIQALDSYTERSISGKGIHVLAMAQLPPAGRKKGDVEMYDGARFFILTGDVLFGKTEIHERQAEVTALHREVFGDAPAAGDVPVHSPGWAPSYEVDDDVLLARACSAGNGVQFRALWQGDTGGYASQSEADLALAGMLAFWTHGDAPGMDRLFRRSGLYRPKWDEPHFTNGATYGQATIARALQSREPRRKPAATPAPALPLAPAQPRPVDFASPPDVASDTLNHPRPADPAGPPDGAADATPVTVDMPELPKVCRYPPELAASASPWLDMYIAYSRAWAPRAFDNFHEAVGLWVLSTAAARRCMTHLGGPRYTNLYLANVARSSVWTKTTAAKIGEETLRRAGLGFLLAPDESTPQGFILATSASSVPDWDKLAPEQQERFKLSLAFAAQRGWAYDEFGTKIDGLMRENGPMADFRGLLRRWDDCPEDYEYVTTGRGRSLVLQPYLSLLATLTPADLARHARQGGPLWQDGFFARFAFISPPADALPVPARFPAGERVPPPWLIERLVRWHNSLGIPEVEVQDRAKGEGKKGSPPQWEVTIHRPAPLVLPLGEGVTDGYYRYHDALVELAAGSANADWDGNYSRFAEKALRVAMLVAAIEGCGEIELRHWARGQEIAERWRAGLHNVYAAVNSGQASAQAVLEDRIMSIVGRLRVASASQICNYIKGEARTAVASTLERLARAGLLDIAEVSRKGTPRYALPTGAEWN